MICAALWPILKFLEKNGIITVDVAAQLRKAIKQLQVEVKNGFFAPLPEDEDVHSALERGLKEKLAIWAEQSELVDQEMTR